MTHRKSLEFMVFQLRKAKKVALDKQVKKLRDELAAIKKDHEKFISNVKKEMELKKLKVKQANF